MNDQAVYLELTGRLVVVEQEGGIVAPALFLVQADPVDAARGVTIRDLLAAVNTGAALGSDPNAIDVAAEVLGAFRSDLSPADHPTGTVDLGPVRIVIMTKPADGADVWTIVDEGGSE